MNVQRMTMLARTGRCRWAPGHRGNWEALMQKTVARATATATQKYLTGAAHFLRPRVGVKATPAMKRRAMMQAMIFPTRRGPSRGIGAVRGYRKKYSSRKPTRETKARKCSSHSGPSGPAAKPG